MGDYLGFLLCNTKLEKTSSTSMPFSPAILAGILISSYFSKQLKSFPEISSKQILLPSQGLEKDPYGSSTFEFPIALRPGTIDVSGRQLSIGGSK